MDCQIDCTSSLPQIWAIEALACSNQVDIYLLLELLEKTPEISNDIGRNAREWVSLKILERLFIQGACANLDLSKMIRLDPSDRCEDVLERILSETSLSNLKSAGTEMSKWDLEPFIKHKRSNLPKCALKQLKDAILKGNHSISASLKEKSGLSVENQAEPEGPVKGGNCNGITPGGEGNDTNDEFPEPDENLVRVNRKRRSTSERPAGNLSTAHIDSVKKYKHDIIFTEQCEGGKLLSARADGRSTDMLTASVQHIKGKGFAVGRKTHVGSMKLDEPSKDDGNVCTSSKGFVGPDEVLPFEKQVANCDAELNNKPKEQVQSQNIEETKGDKNELCDLKRTNEEVDKSEQNIQILCEVEEIVHISTDNDGNNDDRTDIAQKENASFSLQCMYNRNSLTDCRDQNMLAGASKIYTGEERCSIKKSTHVEVMGENGPPENQCTSKGLVKNDVPDEKQAPHCDAELLTENLDEAVQCGKGENTKNGMKRFDGSTTINRDMDKFDQNDIRAVPTVSEADEDVEISSDNDGYHDEKTNINTKKKIFLSSQCTYSQDSLSTTDRRELNHCIKCSKGGKLYSCSSDSCPIVIHESCLGSNAAFDRTGKFYCPFCAYSQAISEYMKVKKKVSQGRKDLATFMCLGPKEDSKRHYQRPCWIKGECLQHNDGLSKSNELNRREEKVSPHQRRKKLEFEQAERSELRSGSRPPFGGNIVDSTDRLSQSLNKDKQDVEGMQEESQSLNIHGRQQLDALAVCNSHGGTTGPSETSKSEEHADVRSKRGVSRSPETDLPCERKRAQRSESADAEESSKEDSGASKYFIRVRKLERQTLCPAIPQLRRKRLPWTSEEEEKLKEGVHHYCRPHDITIPWREILKFGEGVFQPSRSTMDLKDKWRNMCKASPIPKSKFHA